MLSYVDSSIDNFFNDVKNSCNKLFQVRELRELPADVLLINRTLLIRFRA